MLIEELSAGSPVTHIAWEGAGRAVTIGYWGRGGYSIGKSCSGDETEKKQGDDYDRCDYPILASEVQYIDWASIGI